jgi:phospholipase C
MTCRRDIVHQLGVVDPMTLPFAPYLAAAILAIAGVQAATVTAPPSAPRATVTPSEHLIVVGENLSFDNLFATYEPPAGLSVGNLLSRGIVNKDGGPAPHFADAAQREATVRDRYSVTPPSGAAFAVLPHPSTNFAKDLPHYAPDTRFPTDLPNGPFRITRYAPYTAAVGDPVHRFFQMWQQIDGGKKDLLTGVGLTSGEGSRKRDDPLSGTNQGATPTTIMPRHLNSPSTTGG